MFHFIEEEMYMHEKGKNKGVLSGKFLGAMNVSRVRMGRNWLER